MSRMENENAPQAKVGDQLRDTAQQVGQNIRDAGTQVKDAAQERINQFRDQAGDYYEQGRQRAIEWEEGLETYVQDNPVRALLMAAGVGALLGFLWRRS